MPIRANELKGRAVVTLSDATKVGYVDDVLFDAHYREVLGFRVKQGAFSRAEALPRTSVTSLGADAITISSPDAINSIDRFANMAGSLTLSQAHGTKVVTEGGELLGAIQELELDDSAEHVLVYVLDAPLLDRMRHREPRIEASQVLRFGESGILIVANAAGEQLHAEA